MRFYNPQSARLLFFLLLMLLALPACGQRPATLPTSPGGDRPAPAPQTNGVGGQAPLVPLTDGVGSPASGFLPPPENLPLQIAYAPGAAGGGGSVIECGNTEVPGTGEKPFSFTGEPRPYLFTVGSAVSKGGFIAICYFNFPVGPIEEHITGPDGALVVTHSFTIDRPDDVDSTDFTVFPDDLPGAHTVSVTSEAGKFTTTFEVIAQPAVNAQPELPSRLLALGRGTNGAEPRSGDVEYLYLRDFTAAESVQLFFYERCRPREPGAVGRDPYNYFYRFGVEVQVNDQGDLFWKMPPEVRGLLGDSQAYKVLARGQRTSDGAGVDGAAGFQHHDEDARWQGEGVDFAGGALIDGAPDDVPLICPIIPRGQDSTAPILEPLQNTAARAPLFAEVATLSGHEGQVWGVAFSPDGATLASSSFDRTVRLWDVAARSMKAVLQGHEKSVLTVSFSADNYYLASSSNDATVRLWSAIDGTAVGVADGFGGPVARVVFEPTGWAATAVSFDGTARRVSAFRDGQIQLGDPMVSGTEELVALAFSLDEHYLAVGTNGGSITLLESDEFGNVAGGPTHHWEAHDKFVHSLAFSLDSQTLASASGDGTVKLWRVSDGALLATLEGHEGPVWGVTYSPDGQVLASASDDHTIKLWDARNGALLNTLTGHTDAVWTVAFSPDGSMLASASVDTTIKLWTAP